MPRKISKSSTRFKTDSRQNDAQDLKPMTWSQWNEETLAWLMFDSIFTSINTNTHKQRHFGEVSGLFTVVYSS